MLATVAGAGHTQVIKPWPLRPATTHGFTLDDYIVHETAGTMTYPTTSPPWATSAPTVASHRSPGDLGPRSPGEHATRRGNKILKRALYGVSRKGSNPRIHPTVPRMPISKRCKRVLAINDGAP
jgi:hypothetical protein